MRRKVRCYYDEREKGFNLGRKAVEWISYQRDTVKKEDKNLTVLCFAPVRSGKSNLSFHFYNEYSQGKINLNQIGFSPETNVRAFQLASEKKGFCIFDEFNFSRRDSMTSWNKDVIDLFNAVAGLNVALWANNPDADTLDRNWINQGLCQYFCFVYAPRNRFYLFTLKGMKDLLRDQGNLEFDTVKKHGRYYAFLDSYWNVFKGPEWDDYLPRKDVRMKEKLTKIVDKYGTNTYSSVEAAKKLGVHRHTVTKHAKDLFDSGELSDAKNPAGHYQFTVEDLALIENSIIQFRQEGHNNNTRVEGNDSDTEQRGEE